MRRALSLLVLLPLAGCGSTESDSSLSASEASTALERSAENTMSAGRAKVTLDGSMSAEGVDPIEFEAAGVADFAARRSRLAIDMSEIAQAAAMLEGKPEDWKGMIVYDGDAVYIQMPALSGKCWTGYDAGWGSSQGNTGFNAPDPDELLRFADVAKGVEATGTETVRGVKTTHLRGEIDVDDLPQIVPKERRPGFRKGYTQRLKEAGLRVILLDVWIDAEERIRRLAARYDGLMTGDRETDVEFRIEAFDFGTNERVKVPPASAFAESGKC